MKKNRKIIGLIPARGGSKGIPRKNLVLLSGKPLIDYTIEAAKNSGVFSDIVVSSDDEEILEHCQTKGVTKCKRPESLSNDLSSADEVVNHFISTYDKLAGDDVLIYLQPTSPLRAPADIINSLDLYLSSPCAMIVSVFEPSHHPLKCFSVDNNGLLQGFVNPDYPFMPRQILPRVMLPNGAIYIFSVESFLESKTFPRLKLKAYEMNAASSIDIDSKLDLKIAETLLNV